MCYLKWLSEDNVICGGQHTNMGRKKPACVHKRSGLRVLDWPSVWRWCHWIILLSGFSIKGQGEVITAFSKHIMYNLVLQLIYRYANDALIGTKRVNTSLFYLLVFPYLRHFSIHSHFSRSNSIRMNVV